jgi:YVTN family beta-propeller protein
MRTSFVICRFVMFALLAAAVSAQAETAKDLPVRKPAEDVNSEAVRTRASLTPNKDLLFNGWGVTPAGEHVACGDLALKMLVAPDKKAVVAVCAGYNQVGVNVVQLDAQRQTQFIPLKEVFNGLAFARDGRKFYVSGGDSGVIYVFNYAEGQATLDKEVKPKHQESPVFLTGMAVHPSTGVLYICNEANHEIWVVAPDTMEVAKTIDVGQHPHSCVVGGDGRHLYVSNWGGRSVSVIDIEKAHRVRDIAVGVRPNDMALAPDGRLFVACSGDNSVHVIATGKLEKVGPQPSPARRLSEAAREIISTSLYPQSPEGSTPCSVAVSPDGRTLFVANADNNAVMVADISGRLMEEAKDRGELISLVEGFIPTGWYPSAVAVSPDNQFVLVANGKGLASRASSPPQNKPSGKKRPGVPFDHPGKTFVGSISFIAKPDARQMAAHTEQVRRNSPFHPEQLAQAPLSSDTVIPSKVGDPCPIKYVLYIIKENRTYY